ncbi:MAG: BMP family ABC transporter substrate-binding protein [Termitinemataceae bacterium]|nr:MAG: BMP family ABC transporter substrate-binding protein [Termitinemataceae bacterium]
MKKLFGVLLVVVCFTALSLSCKKKNAEADVALLINGTLGDRSFHDSANNGMKLVSEKLGLKTKVVEVGYDTSKWGPALRDLCDEKYEIIVCGTWQMQEIVQRVVNEYPKQKFIIYDASVDYANDTKGLYKNVYSIEYKQNEGSYLAGALAASMSKTSVVGFVGAMDNTVIRDFLVGYVQGAKDTNSGIKVLSSFIGSFSDTAKAKELTFAQYQMDADIVFSVAANAGEGSLQAAKEKNKYAIGVDSDQGMLYLQSDPALAKLILSSMLKRVDESILLAVTEAQNGTLAWGTRALFGIEENCVGLAENEIYDEVVPQNVRELIKVDMQKIQNGEVNVATAFGMSDDAFNELIK